MIQETIFTNTILVLPDETLNGSIVVRGRTITDVQPGRSHVMAALDLDGDTLIPGLVDIHTDNLERQV